MIIPTPAAAAAAALLGGGDPTFSVYPPTSATATVSATPTYIPPGPRPAPENWSSLIGIVTAIVGNVLISFALNTQRYAHIRLNREWEERERDKGVGLAGNEGDGGDVAVRSGRSRRGRRSKAGTDAEDGFGETEPLLASGSRSSSEEDGEIGGRAGESPALSSVPPKEQTDEEGKQKSYLRSPYWWTGIVLMTIGEAGNFLAYGFAPASIVSPLGVVALISNCIIAPVLLKEPFRKRDFFGVVVAVAGAVTVVLSASDNNPKLGPDEIWKLIGRWEFETYLAITVVCIAALTVASNRYGDKLIVIDLGLVGLYGEFGTLVVCENGLWL